MFFLQQDLHVFISNFIFIFFISFFLWNYLAFFVELNDFITFWSWLSTWIRIFNFSFNIFGSGLSIINIFRFWFTRVSKNMFLAAFVVQNEHLIDFNYIMKRNNITLHWFSYNFQKVLFFFWISFLWSICAVIYFIFQSVTVFIKFFIIFIILFWFLQINFHIFNQFLHLTSCNVFIWIPVSFLH